MADFGKVAENLKRRGYAVKEFATAKELVEACVFNGKSLEERWDKVIIYSIEGIDLQDWLEVCEHCY